MPDRAHLQLLALGPPEVRAGDEVVELPPKLLAALVFLALKPSRDAIRRDTLLATFWPEADGPHARNALNQVVHQLRRRLGRDVIESRGKNELSLNGYLESDVERFEALLDEGALERALALYRGAFLEGFHIRDAPGFERWLDGVRAQLKLRVRKAALGAAASAEQDEQLDRAIGYLRRLVEIAPTDEQAARQLIRLLLAADDRAAAVREYRWLVRRLDSELGVSPSEMTRKLITGAGVNSVPEIITRPGDHRRYAGALTERAAELLGAGSGENLAARELLEQAIRLDPTFAPAYAQQALAISKWVELFGGPWGYVAAGQAAAGRALELAPELPEAHLARATLLAETGHLAEAIRSYRAVLRLRPHNAPAAAGLGLSLFWAGKFAEAHDWIYGCASETDDASESFHGLALVHMSLDQRDLSDHWYRRAISNRPHDRYPRSSRVYFHFTSGHFDCAIELGRAMVRLEPGAFIAQNALGDALFMAEEFEEAIGAYERCYAIDPESRNWGHRRATRTALGYSHLRAGDSARGRQMLEIAERENRRLLANRPDLPMLHWSMAGVLAAQGKTDGALSWLERSYEHGLLQHAFVELDPIFTDLREEPRFRDVLAAMRREVVEQRGRLSSVPP